MRGVALVFAATTCLLTLNPLVAVGQGTGSIQGRVVNGTADGGSVGGLQVALRVFHGEREGGPVATEADAEGHFYFEGVDSGSDRTYVIQVSYQDVVYSKGLLSFESPASELGTEISVYETTTDDAGIYTERAHLFLEVTDVGLRVAELHVFANPGDRTYVGGEEIQGRRATSRFLLPQGSYGLSFVDGSLGERFLLTGGGFADTEPLWPGKTTVMFRYLLHCESGDCSLIKDVTRPIATLNVLIADTGAQVMSDRLTSARKVEAQGQRYLNYAGLDLRPGERLDVRVSLPQQGPARKGYLRAAPTSLPWMVVGTLATILILGYPFWRQHVQQRPVRAPRGEDGCRRASD